MSCSASQLRQIEPTLTHTHAGTQAHTYTGIYTQTHRETHHMHAHKHTCKCICTHIYIGAQCTDICAHGHAYAQTHTTHVHAHTHRHTEEAAVWLVGLGVQEPGLAPSLLKGTGIDPDAGRGAGQSRMPGAQSMGQYGGKGNVER